MTDAGFIGLLAAELSLPVSSVEGTVALLAEGATAPFIARYRRERSGGLGEGQVREVASRLRQLQGTEQRRTRLLKQLESEGRLTEELRARVEACVERAELEELAAASRRRRRTRGSLAIERGLEPLARAILAQEAQAAPMEELAAGYVSPERGVPDAAAALEGARQIIAEWVAENPDLREKLRQLFMETAVVRSKVAEDRAGEHSKYETYYDFSEPATKIPSHRVLAIRRGQKEGWLQVRIEADRERALGLVREAVVTAPSSPAATVVETAMADAYDRLIAPSLDGEVRAELKRRADAEAIGVFSRNLRSLLLQPTAGPRRTLGVDPGYRTGCKLAAVDGEGKLLDHATIYPHPPQSQVEESRAAVKALIEKHNVEAIAVGNGNAARETEHFFRDLLKEMPQRRIVRTVVNEAGANAYATSRAAREEFPELDPAVRSAVSIARRFQDPMAELVEVDPRAIGVGQYQHDVNQQVLREGLGAAVESCVNFVGVDLNGGSAALLSYVAGVGRGMARELVSYRAERGPFRSRAQLKELPRFTDKRLEQAAGFLLVRGGEEPLDATAIHPERYELVRRIAADAGTDVLSLLGNQALIEKIDFSRYASEGVGEPTLADIHQELLWPGQDPRGAFRQVELRDDVAKLEDLKLGMVLEGTVTNVTNFGAFVDIGLQEDGLVHVSHLARRYVKNPIEAVHVGDVVRVKVLSVDTERRRIGLSIKEALPPPPQRKPRPKPKEKEAAPKPPRAPKPPKETKPKRDPFAKATPEDIARLIAHFQSR